MAGERGVLGKALRAQEASAFSPSEQSAVQSLTEQNAVVASAVSLAYVSSMTVLLRLDDSM